METARHWVRSGEACGSTVQMAVLSGDMDELHSSHTDSPNIDSHGQGWGER